MNIDDLEKFLVIARYQHMQKAAAELDTTPGGLSKALKRLETQLSTLLFDRVGKNIVLNDAGRQLQPQAAQLVSQAKQTRSLFAQSQNQPLYRICGPAILQSRWAPLLSRQLQKNLPSAQVQFETRFEQEALTAVIKGHADFALVTEAVKGQIPQELYVQALDSITIKIAAAKHHPLVAGDQHKVLSLPAEEVLKYPFAAPSISPYCGEHRGVGCDGWDNLAMPRNVRYVVNDISVLSGLVRAGLALAYLPDYWLRDWQFIEIGLNNWPSAYQEHVMLIGRDQSLLAKLTGNFDE